MLSSSSTAFRLGRLRKVNVATAGGFFPQELDVLGNGNQLPLDEFDRRN